MRKCQNGKIFDQISKIPQTITMSGDFAHVLGQPTISYKKKINLKTL